jgi:hypothetical protein
VQKCIYQWHTSLQSSSHKFTKINWPEVLPVRKKQFLKTVFWWFHHFNVRTHSAKTEVRDFHWWRGVVVCVSLFGT